MRLVLPTLWSPSSTILVRFGGDAEKSVAPVDEESMLGGGCSGESDHSQRLSETQAATSITHPHNSFVRMKLSEKIALYNGSHPFYTFEFFPPRTDQVAQISLTQLSAS